MNWQRRAACRDIATDLFFPVGTTGEALERDLAEAFAVCARCPVRADCAAARLPSGGGIWGGVFYLDNGRPWTPPDPKPKAAPPAGSPAELIAAMSSVDSNPYRHKAAAS